MSKSRLEKFLYALYSLDSRDLPTPLSRIEELYKCLVTGEEAPTFEPISRTEKYLMAILGVYDVNELPNPISRVEVLLYKLATGDDNLDDIKSFLSEHEELLAEIIRNGGVGGNINIEYVLYTLSSRYNTLYNTAKKPVKSAILKGQTLVNLNTNTNVSQNLSVSTTRFYRLNIPYNIVANKQFTLKLNIKDSTVTQQVMLKTTHIDDTLTYDVLKNGNDIGFINRLFTKAKDVKNIEIYLQATETGNVTVENIMMLEGDYTNVDIPYFEGMQSVKMPVLKTIGKNLFTGKYSDFSDGGYGSFKYGEIGKNYTISLYDNDTNISLDGISLGISVKGNEGNTLNWMTNGNEIYISQLTKNTLDAFTIRPNNEESLRKIMQRFNIQIEENSVATSYEPHKSNILTVNEDLELRGIGDVKDTLDCLTGEVVERVGYADINSFVAPPSYRALSDNQGYMAVIELENKKQSTDLVANLVKVSSINNTDFGMYNNPANIIVFRKNCSLDELKSLINQIQIVYELETESVKTVDLSVVDQDGNDTKLSTFNDITHVTLSSEGLIHEAELEVAEKVTEVAVSMLTISREQKVINAITNEQSENVDATMIATTEIYEDLL